MSPPAYRPSQKLLWTSILISLLLHLGGVGLVEYVWWGVQDERLVKVRLTPHLPPVHLEIVPVAGGQAAPLTRMERLAPERGAPRPLSEAQLPMAGEVGGGTPGPQGRSGSAYTSEGAPLALREGTPGGRGDEGFAAPGEKGPALGGLARPGTGRETDRSFDLLRLQDMARANRDHAAVIPNWASRRDLKGYLNLTKVKGVGFGSNNVEELARYMRDNTGLLVQVSPGYYQYFLNDQLLKDPLHIFLPGGLRPPTPYPGTRMSEEEVALLGRYLRGSGFLYIGGDKGFLNEMVAYLHLALNGEGRLYPLPLSHPLYTAYYDFSEGFPYEDLTLKKKWFTLPWEHPWHFPGNPSLDLVADRTGLELMPRDPRDKYPVPNKLGLWGVELGGELVAVLSDVPFSPEAGTNVVVYALTRQGGLTPKLPPPAWEHLKPQAPLAERPESGAAIEEEEVQESLDASLALVQTPLGRELEEGGIQVIVDGYSVELLKGGLHGLVLHNLPPGAHWLELRYGGKRKQIDVDLKGGQVRTVTFGLNRFGFLTQLRLSQQEELMGLEAWRINFGDLQIEEVYWEEDREKLE